MSENHPRLCSDDRRLGSCNTNFTRFGNSLLYRSGYSGGGITTRTILTHHIFSDLAMRRFMLHTFGSGTSNGHGDFGNDNIGSVDGFQLSQVHHLFRGLASMCGASGNGSSGGVNFKEHGGGFPVHIGSGFRYTRNFHSYGLFLASMFLTSLGDGYFRNMRHSGSRVWTHPSGKASFCN